MNCNVIDYGARAAKNFGSTAAFQSAIDACAEAGGGKVTVPAGNFYIDMISLRDNIELYLENGTVIFSLLDRIPENRDDYEEPSFNMKRYLVGGVKIKNAAITGYGTFDGRGYVNFWNKNDGYEHPLYGQRYWPLTHRPRGLIHFRECTDIRIEDITILDPPAYNVWLLGCDRCDIKNIRIRTDTKGPNNDGLDIDCCSNIYITGCDIVTNDDAVGIFSDINTLGYDKACENIIVSDCRIMAVSDGIRVGYVGDGAIRNVTFSNCVIYNTMIGISMMVAISPDDCRGVYIKYGPKISNINFINLVIDAEETFNFQSPKGRSSKPIIGFMDEISLSNITAVARRGSFFSGVAESPLGRITISDLKMTLTGDMGTDFEYFIPDPYPVWTDMTHSGIPYPFHIRYANDFRVINSSVRYKNASGAWQKKLFTAENAEPVFENVVFKEEISDPYTTEFLIDRHNSVPFFVDYHEEKCHKNSEKLKADSIALPLCPTEETINKSPDEWSRLFAELKNEGVKRVILPAVVYLELYYRFYASSRYAPLPNKFLLDVLLEAGKNNDIEVFCGSCFSTVPFRKRITEQDFEKELLEHRCCISEIYRKDDIAGFFIPLEVFSGVELPGDFTSRAVEICKNFVAALRSRNDSRPVILPVSENIDFSVYETLLSGGEINAAAINIQNQNLQQYTELCNKLNIQLIKFRKEF